MNGTMQGMLWYDGSTKPLAEKIKLAMAYYRETYKKPAPLCLVHPADALALDLDAISQECGVVVRTAKLVVKSHFWIGEEVIVVEEVDG